MANIQELDHPLCKVHLAKVRQKTTSPAEFRTSIRQLTYLAGAEATRSLPLVSQNIETPIETCEGHRLQSEIGLVPILRAGVGMVEPMLDLLPDCQVWHLGLYRDERTATPVGYYNKLPDSCAVDRAFVLDPMLATGGSALMACETLEKWGVAHIHLISIIAAPQGIEKVSQRFPEVEVTVCCIDQGLNDQKYIVPGLGDAGDRLYNTL